MDYDLLKIIKQEKERLLDNNDSKVYIDCQFKKENENFEEWCTRNALLGYQEQENISYEELKKEEYIFICSSCDKVFSDEISLYKHNLVHLKVPLYNKKLYICDNCCYCSKNKDSLEKHILMKHNINKRVRQSLYECKICNRSFKYSNWLRHTKYAHSEPNFKCEKCLKVFRWQSDLKKHNLTVHEGVKQKYKREIIKCPKCPAYLCHKNSLSTHKRKCHGKEKFQCKICMSTFKCKSYLSGHLTRVHCDGEVYSCKICMSTFKCKTYLLVHMKRVHYNDGEVHSCELCSKIFNSQTNLKSHIKNIHTVKVGTIKKKFLNM